MAILRPTYPPDVAAEESDPSSAFRLKKGGIRHPVWKILFIGIPILLLIAVGTNTATIRFVLRKIDNRYTVNDFNRIQFHMSEDQVTAILGEPDEVRESRDFRVRSCDHYVVWKSGRNEIVVGFTKGAASYMKGTFTTLTGDKTETERLRITFGP